MVLCVGCNVKEAIAFQCPLCQAEEAEDEGFFCSQECFASNWISHRDNFHKGGTVKAGAKRKRTAATEEAKPVEKTAAEAAVPTKGKLERKLKVNAKKVEEKPVEVSSAVAPWQPLPDARDCDSQGWAAVKPALNAKTTKAVVQLPKASTVVSSFWSCAFAGARLVSDIVSQVKGTETVVVCGSQMTTHAFAWAMRCIGIARRARLILSVSDDDMKIHPSKYFSTDVPVVLTSVSLLRSQGKKVATNLSEWMDNRTVIVMPDVANPDELQTLTSKAITFVCQSGEIANTFESDDYSHKMEQLIPMSFAAPVANDALGTRFDNLLSTHAAQGNLLGFVERIINLFSTSKNRVEEVLTNTLFVDWGSAAGAVLAHHKLAFVMRYLADHSDKFAASSADLVKIAVRVIARVAKCLPAIPVADVKSKACNLSLVATVSYLYTDMSSQTVDALGSYWGFSKVIEGTDQLTGLNKTRKEIVSRIRHRYGAKLGPRTAEFLVVLMHLLHDLVTPLSLTVEEVDNATQFSATLAHDVGSLDAFLRLCELFGHSGAAAKTNAKAKGAVAPPSGLVHPPQGAVAVSTPFAALPVSGRRQREVDRLTSMALDEILMAMPRQPVPMYIGDVGNLIGIWTKFNAKYDGSLAYTLSEFLERNPETFKVVGNIVTRLKAGTVEQVRVRFDNDKEEGSDDEDKGRRTRDRKALTGLGSKGKNTPIHHSAKARKKAEKKERNAARYNKNRQTFDKEKMVPGYTKHGPRKLKGRGRKANIRNFKRPAAGPS
ncbi:Hypothetical protein, putative [Bodo saltans]|uniref:C6H2-type domain-containing protein n=1 Tax=Bodo saltans TaxID=75058 RepID=A0A0S4IS90_BODSA|nr:Hypothetical protein, putative [Bodo saltans]|eukprot:CUG05476.1 Hypothetical protein, putative [Bodo saltans]